MTLPLPRAQSAYVDATGRPTTEFYKWLQSVERDSGGSDPALALAIRQIAEKLGSPDGSVAGIPNVYPGLSEDTSIVGIGGQIQVSGTLASGEALIGLASVTDSGAGELLAITRDGFGRVSGTKPVVAGAGVEITDEITQVVISATAQTEYISSDGDFYASDDFSALYVQAL